LRSQDSSFNIGPLSPPLTVFFPEYENCPPPHRDHGEVFTEHASKEAGAE
jgi:hypothetical protein